MKLALLNLLPHSNTLPDAPPPGGGDIPVSNKIMLTVNTYVQPSV